MKVTAAMVDRALASWEAREPATRTKHMREALEAALADVPEPHTCSAIDKLEDMQAVIDAERVRIAELEAQLSKVRAWIDDTGFSDEDVRRYIAGVLDDRVARLPEDR